MSDDQSFDDGPIGQVALEFVCTDQGSHAPIAFGFITFAEHEDRPTAFIRTHRIERGEDQYSERLDERCPRCRRHHRLNRDTMHRLAIALLAANLDEARAWRRRNELFRRSVDMSSREFL